MIVPHMTKVQAANVISRLPFLGKKEKVKAETKPEMGTTGPTTEVPQVPEVSQTSEAPQVPEMSQVLEVSQVPEAPQVPEMP